LSKIGHRQKAVSVRIERFSRDGLFAA